MVEFRGSIDEKLYMRALRLHGGGLRILAVIFVIAGLVTIPSSALVAATFITGGIVFWFLPWVMAKRVLGSSRVLRAPFAGQLDEQGYSAESEVGRSNVAWTLFHHSIVGKDLILLYISAQQFQILPREFFASDAAFAEAQDLVRRNVPARKKRRLLAIVLWLIIVFCVWALLQITSTPTP